MYSGGRQAGFNDGSRWDMLSHVLYGYIDALNQASRKLNKKCNIRIHNFADTQTSSDEISVSEFMQKASPDILKTIFKPENGYDVENLNIHLDNDGRKRTYVIVTDGNLVISGRTTRESQKMKQLAKYPDTNVVLFEIGGSYGLGEVVKNNPNINYYPVHEKDEMLRKGLEVLLKK